METLKSIDNKPTEGKKEFKKKFEEFNKRFQGDQKRQEQVTDLAVKKVEEQDQLYNKFQQLSMYQFLNFDLEKTNKEFKPFVNQETLEKEIKMIEQAKQEMEKLELTHKYNDKKAVEKKFENVGKYTGVSTHWDSVKNAFNAVKEIIDNKMRNKAK